MKHYGTLTVYVYTSDARIPIEGAKITVTTDLSPGAAVIAEETTDRDGYIRPIRLETPDAAESCCPGQETPFTAVAVTAYHPDYMTQSAAAVQIFPGTATVQGFRMIPAAPTLRDPNPYQTPDQDL